MTLIKKFFAKTLTDKEEKELLDYAREDEQVRRMMIRAASFSAEVDEMFGLDKEEPEIHEKENKRRKRLVLYTSSIAAAILILALIFVFTKEESYTNEQLYEEFYAPMELTVFRNNMNYDGSSKIRELYVNDNYEAIRQEVTKNKTEAMKDFEYLFAGIAFMESENIDKAANLLQQIPEKSHFYPTASWYLALVNLRNGNIDKCLDYLDKAGDSLVFYERVEELREKVGVEMR